MKNKKNVILILIIILVIILLSLFLSTGNKRSDVYLKGFQLSSDGTKMTLNVGVSSSAGYIRKMKRSSGSMDYYCTFYSTFGINSSLGSKDTFVIDIDNNVSSIYFYTGDNGYRKVLEKNDLGEWIQLK